MDPMPTILIVDDQEAGRFTLESLLAQQGYHLQFATSGAEALAKVAAETPDIILLDIMMPDMDGFEVCRRLRADPATEEIPVIFITALNDHNSMIRGMEIGADDFISKPFDKVRLRARLHTITRLNRYRRLQLERAKFEWAVKQSDHGYLMLSPDGGVLYSNPRARQYLNMPQPPAVATGNFLELIRRGYQPQPPEAWDNWPAPPPEGVNRFLVRPETGNTPSLWLQVDVLDSGQAYSPGVMLRLRNVTAQMVARRNLRSFHGAIQHKLRTPMVGMIGGLDILVNEVAYLQPEETAEMAQIAMASANRLRDSIEDILKYLGAPEERLNQSEGCPLAEIETLVHRVSAELGLQQVTFANTAARLPGTLTISGRTLDIILRELLENSRKFHPQHNPQVHIALLPHSNSRVTLRATDNGRHIRPEKLPQVWMPYFQDEKNFTGQIAGMGLGLSMVASLVWSVDGGCDISNRTDGPGVTVEIVLPCRPAAHRVED